MMQLRVSSLGLSLLVSVTVSLRAETFVWTNATGGNWSVPANWEPNLVPHVGSTVFITNSGTYTVTLDTDVSVGDLVVGGGGGTQSLSINGYSVTPAGGGLVQDHGRIALESGTLGGPAWTIASGGTLELMGTASLKELYAGVLTNAGRINYSGDQFRLQAARLCNVAGGVLDLQADNGIGWYYGWEDIQNAGVIRKSGGSGTTTLSPVLTNTGTVEVQSGSLSLADGGSLGGVLTAAAGTELVFAGGTLWYRDGLVWGGVGAKRLSGGTLHCEGLSGPADLADVTLSGGTVMADGVVTNLTLRGAGFYGNDATIAGTGGLISGSMTGTNRLTGTMSWEGGAVSGALTVAGGGTLNLTGSANLKELSLGVLTNAGRINYSGDQFRLQASRLCNVAGGVLDLQADNGIGWYYGWEDIQNAGVIRKSGGSGTTTLSPVLHNTGTVEVQSGSLSLAGGGSLGGVLTAAAGTELVFAGGTLWYRDGLVWGGVGVKRLSGGTLHCEGLSGPADLADVTLTGGTVMADGVVANLTLRGAGFVGTDATIAGTGGLISGSMSGTNRLTGTMSWEGGAVSGALTVAGGGTLNLTGSANLKELSLGVLTNAGRINYSGEQFRLQASRLCNVAGGVLDLQADTGIGWYHGSEDIQNAGVIRKSGGSGTTTLYPVLNNTGTVEVQSGSLSLADGGSLGGVLTAAAGTELVFAGGAAWYRDGLVWGGVGVKRLSGGTLHCEGLSGPADLADVALSGGTVMADGVVTNLTLRGASFYGNDATIAGTGGLISGSMTGTNRLTGTMSWEGGAVSGALTVAGGGTLNLTGSANLKELSLGALTTAGRINYSGEQFRLQASRLCNVAGGVLDLQVDTGIGWYYGSEDIQNAGVIRKSGGSGTTTLYPVLNNTGTVEVQSGSLSLADGGSLGGVLTAAAGTELVFAGGTAWYRDGLVWGGVGVKRLSGGTLHCKGLSGPADLADVTLTGGTVMADGVVANLTLRGAGFVGTDATIAGIGGLKSGSMTGTNRLTGTMSWEGGAVSGALTVAGGGTLNLTGGANLKELSLGVLTNAGRINYSGDQFRLQASRLCNVAGGVLDLQADTGIGWYYGSEDIQNAGVIRKSGGSGTTTLYPVLHNTGTVEAQSGTLYFAGAANLGGSVVISIGGNADYGRLQFAAAPAVAGSLNVALRNGFLPHPGDSFLVLSFPSLIGSFTCMNGLDFGAGLRLDPHLAKTSLTLTAVSVPTNSVPALSLQPVGKTLLLRWPIEFADWQLLTTTNLLTATWTPVPVSGTNNTILSTLAPQAYFRLQESQ